MLEAFKAWVAMLAESEDYGNIHQDDPEEQAEFWINAFMGEIAEAEETREYYDYDDSDTYTGLAYNDIVGEFFDE